MILWVEQVKLKLKHFSSSTYYVKQQVGNFLSFCLSVCQLQEANLIDDKIIVYFNYVCGLEVL